MDLTLLQQRIYQPVSPFYCVITLGHSVETNGQALEIDALFFQFLLLCCEQVAIGMLSCRYFYIGHHSCRSKISTLYVGELLAFQELTPNFYASPFHVTSEPNIPLFSFVKLIAKLYIHILRESNALFTSRSGIG